MQNSQNKFLNVILIILSAIIIGLIAFLSSYYFFMNKSLNKYRNKLNFEITNINKINMSVSDINLTEDSIENNNRIINTMHKNISSLQNYVYALKTINPSTKYNLDHENLINGVQNNILIYKQILSITKSIDNIDGKTLNNSLKTLDKYINYTLEFYSKVSIRNVKIDLPNETLDFLNSFKNEVKQQAKATITTRITKNQTSNFINFLNNITVKFNNLKKDYINEIKNGIDINGYSALLNELSKDEVSLNALKSNLSNLPIPKNANETFNNLIKTIDDYNYYIEKLIYNLNIEKLTSKNDTINKHSLKTLYNSSREDLKRISKSYEDFLDSFSKFKSY